MLVFVLGAQLNASVSGLRRTHGQRGHQAPGGRQNDRSKTPGERDHPGSAGDGRRSHDRRSHQRRSPRNSGEIRRGNAHLGRLLPGNVQKSERPARSRKETHSPLICDSAAKKPSAFLTKFSIFWCPVRISTSSRTATRSATKSSIFLPRS